MTSRSNDRAAVLAILGRVGAILGTTVDAEIAKGLGASPQNLATWKSRGTVPYERLCEFALRKDVSLDWLLLGKGAPSQVGNPIDGDLLYDIVRATFLAVQRVPGRINMSFVVDRAAAIYEKVRAIAEPTERKSAVDAEANGSAAAWAAATAHVLRKKGNDKDAGELDALAIELDPSWRRGKAPERAG
jgi:hypothetical protein